MTRGRFFQWAMTIAVNMVNDYYRRKKNAPTMVALEDNVALWWLVSAKDLLYRKE